MEYEEVKVKLPKKLAKFLRAMEKVLGQSMEEYLQYSIVDMVRADLDTEDIFVPTQRQIVEKHGLGEIYEVSRAGLRVRLA